MTRWRRTSMERARGTACGVIVTLAVAAVFTSAPPPASAQDTGPAAVAPSAHDVDTEFARVRADFRARRWHDVLERGDALMRHHPDHADAARLRWDCAQAAFELGDLRTAAAFAESTRGSTVAESAEVESIAAIERLLRRELPGGRAALAELLRAARRGCGRRYVGWIEEGPLDVAAARGGMILAGDAHDGELVAIAREEIGPAAAMVRHHLGLPDLPPPEVLLRRGKPWKPSRDDDTPGAWVEWGFLAARGVAVISFVTPEGGPLLSHELCHAWSLALGPGRMLPTWLEEGIASWAQGDPEWWFRYSLPEFVRRGAVREVSDDVLGNLPLLEARPEGRVGRESRRMRTQYVVGMLILHGVAEDHGREAVSLVADRCLRGGDPRAAFAEATGWPLREVETRLRNLLRQSFLVLGQWRSAVDAYAAGRTRDADLHHAAVERLATRHPVLGRIAAGSCSLAAERARLALTAAQRDAVLARPSTPRLEVRLRSIRLWDEGYAWPPERVIEECDALLAVASELEDHEVAQIRLRRERALRQAAE